MRKRRLLLLMQSEMRPYQLHFAVTGKLAWTIKVENAHAYSHKSVFVTTTIL